MPLDLYIAFVVAVSVLILMPGPIVTLVVATSIARGLRPALWCVVGAHGATVVQLAVIGLGMTSVMVLLSEWFEVVRWIGVGYLIFLGVQQWRKLPVAEDVAPTPGSARRLFWRGFVAQATNPKTLFFYAAFFPQFVDPGAPGGAQFLFLALTFLVIGLILDGGYAVLAGRARRLLAVPGRLRDRVSGSLLIGAGVGLALTRRL